MSSPLEFWFDFSSGYAYFAAHFIDGLGERVGREVLWRPYMLGVAFKATGARGLSSTPLKGDYARNDWARLSRQTGLAFTLPADHPITALPASRAYYWVEENHPDRAHAFALGAFRAYFVEGVDMKQPERVARVGAEVGVDFDRLRDAITSEAMKTRLRSVTEEALAKGVFGSPYFIADGEPFWGFDRMDMLEAWIDSGGW